MEDNLSFNDNGIPEVLAPDGTKLTVAQSIELFRRQIRQMNLMTENSAANLALLYAVKFFAVPQVQAEHWEAIASLLTASQEDEALLPLKSLAEVYLGRELAFAPVPEVVEEPPVEEPIVEVEPVVDQTAELRAQLDEAVKRIEDLQNRLTDEVEARRTAEQAQQKPVENVVEEPVEEEPTPEPTPETPTVEEPQPAEEPPAEPPAAEEETPKE